MFKAIIGNWHFWIGSEFMASDENIKKLLAFKDIDECINWLFLNGHKSVARELNKLGNKEVML